VERCSALELVLPKMQDHRLDGARSAQSGFPKVRHDIMGARMLSDCSNRSWWLAAARDNTMREAAPCGSI